MLIVMFFNRRFILGFALLVSAVWTIGPVEACPTCKEAIHNSTSASAYAISILLMMSMPFAIMAFWLILILNLRSKASRLQPVVDHGG